MGKNVADFEKKLQNYLIKNIALWLIQVQVL